MGGATYIASARRDGKVKHLFLRHVQQLTFARGSQAREVNFACLLGHVTQLQIQILGLFVGDEKRRFDSENRERALPHSCGTCRACGRPARLLAFTISHALLGRSSSTHHNPTHPSPSLPPRIFHGYVQTTLYLTAPPFPPPSTISSRPPRGKPTHLLHPLLQRRRQSRQVLTVSVGEGNLLFEALLQASDLPDRVRHLRPPAGVILLRGSQLRAHLAQLRDLRRRRRHRELGGWTFGALSAALVASPPPPCFASLRFALRGVGLPPDSAAQEGRVVLFVCRLAFTLCRCFGHPSLGGLVEPAEAPNRGDIRRSHC